MNRQDDDHEREMTDEEVLDAIQEEATGISSAVGYLTSGRHPVACASGLMATAAHYAQHAGITKDDFLELAANMWTTAAQLHAEGCPTGPHKTEGQH